MKNFWKKLKKPIYALAPMAGLTDSPFRQICRKYGSDVVYSEMASATALNYNPKKTLNLVRCSKNEHPYVVQLFGANPDHFAKAVKIIEKEIKPDGICINFGCPVKKVMKQGAGGELMKNLKQAKKVLKAVTDNTQLPISVKIRSKCGNIDALNFLKSLEGIKISAVMIHGRTLSQGHSGLVDWQMIKKAKKYFGGIIIANGGVKDKATADDLLEKTGVDGVGIGQAAVGNPWIFKAVKSEKFKALKQKQIIKIILAHAKMEEKLKGERGVVEMRPHLGAYTRGWPDAARIRSELMKCKTYSDIKKALK